ncbi:dynein regulatory complex subunit 5 [Ceratina calcarata]|uniref:Dynein regulatory complex subunit 5 n=1 Tax=Ceratina calcarata TaxID=156304 RepID=A0AAJ7S0G3_9HYME|nr:dynein regulatory complex subunit 5 [Ceratina calcarata]
MKIPHTVPNHVLQTYRCSDETTRLKYEVYRTIQPENVSWDEYRVPSLKTLALRVIASVWEKYPLVDELPTCEDRNALIEILPTDLPFELTITKIDTEFYWERCSKARWEHNDISEHGNSWRRYYCENSFREYLENLEPTFFDAQKEACEKMIELVKDYVHVIELRSLVPTKKRSTSVDDEEDPCLIEEEPVNHIPLEQILPRLPHLAELRINFGLIYMDDGFEWRDFEISIEDCLGLGRGIKACRKLRKFALTRSNLDQPRAAALLQGVAGNESLEEIDFSHCKLGDKGAHAVGEFLSLHKNLRSINLADNGIGPEGIGGTVYGLLKREQNMLRSLNLRLNPLLDAGANYVFAYLLRSEVLEVLDISTCGIEASGGSTLVEILTSGCLKTDSVYLNVSNNSFDQQIGEAFAAALKNAPWVMGFEARLCNFSPESESSIHESVVRNKQLKRKERTKYMLDKAPKVSIDTAASRIQLSAKQNAKKNSKLRNE